MSNHTTGRALFFISMGLTLGLAASNSQANPEGDPRCVGAVTWVSPGDQAVDAYEMRISTSAPGNNVDAWWRNAQVQEGTPSPAPQGTPQSMSIDELYPGETVYAAIRSLDDGGAESPVSPVAGWTPPASPFMQEVTIEPMGEGCDEYVFAILGVGLDAVTEVTFRTPGGTTFTSNQLRPKGQELLGSVVLSSPAAIGQLCVEVSTPDGTDRLDGWVRLASTSGGICAEPEFSPSCVNLQRSADGWHISICGGAQASASAAGAAQEPVVEIFDVLGRQVATPPVYRSGGGWEAEWSGRTSGGRRAASGIFFARVRGSEESVIRKIFLSN